MNVGPGWNLKFVLFYTDNSWNITWDKWNFGSELSWTYILVLFESLFNWDFKYGDGVTFWGFVEKNAEPLCEELL
jgi:hypothetical protein